MKISVTAPYDVGDLVGTVTFGDGTHQRVVLRGGVFVGDLPANPICFKLTTESVPKGEASLRIASLDTPSKPFGRPVDIRTLYEEGVKITDEDKVELQVQFGSPCDSDRLPDSEEGMRFASWEHVICAEYVGKSETKEDPGSLILHGIKAEFDSTTGLSVGNKKLTFGEIICLAGDFYAHLDEEAHSKLSSSWPSMNGMLAWLSTDYRSTTIENDSEEAVRDLLNTIGRDRDTNRGAAGEMVAVAYDSMVNNFPARRYIALATQNYCHFACPRPGWTEDHNEALGLYKAYHQRALAQVRQANNAPRPEEILHRALAIDAFGCHFLTDLCASGHIRVPRRLLGETYGAVTGGWMSKTMHEEDNILGLWCTTRVRNPHGSQIVWRAYGDGVLRRNKSAQHKLQVQEATRRSVAEVFEAYAAAISKQRPQYHGKAEDILPVPLAPGKMPERNAQGPDGRLLPDRLKPNHWPLYWFRPDGMIIKRENDRFENRYRLVDDEDQESLCLQEAWI